MNDFDHQRNSSLSDVALSSSYDDSIIRDADPEYRHRRHADPLCPETGDDAMSDDEDRSYDSNRSA